ncbi:hypothetical protein [Leekyejoonella antrihumi]|nr:hypothetical protein [Leekyejoonella antrihumi]
MLASGCTALQIETLADNEPMLRAARRAGFTGGLADEVLLGLLARDQTGW